MDKNIKNNLEHSIVLMGPCGVGKSLIGSNLSKRLNTPLLDFNDLLACIVLDIKGKLSPDVKTQKKYYKKEFSIIKSLENTSNFSNEELQQIKKLALKHIKDYNYYYNLLGSFEQFHDDFLQYYVSDYKKQRGVEHIKNLNELTLKILKKIYQKTDTPLIISAPASLGWNSANPTLVNMKILQTRVSNFLKHTNNVLLQTGIDYKRIKKTQFNSINDRILIKYPEKYYKDVDLEISTNGLYNLEKNEVINKYGYQSIKDSLREEKIKNQGEIKNITDQIIMNLNDLHKMK